MSATDDDVTGNDGGLDTEIIRELDQPRSSWSEEDVEDLFDQFLQHQEEVTMTQEEIKEIFPDSVDTSPIQKSVKEGAILVSFALLFALIGVSGLWFGVVQDSPAIGIMGVGILAALVYHLWTLNASI